MLWLKLKQSCSCTVLLVMIELGCTLAMTLRLQVSESQGSILSTRCRVQCILQDILPLQQHPSSIYGNSSSRTSGYISRASADGNSRGASNLSRSSSSRQPCHS